MNVSELRCFGSFKLLPGLNNDHNGINVCRYKGTIQKRFEADRKYPPSLSQSNRFINFHINNQRIKNDNRNSQSLILLIRSISGLNGELKLENIECNNVYANERVDTEIGQINEMLIRMKPKNFVVLRSTGELCDITYDIVYDNNGLYCTKINNDNNEELEKQIYAFK